ncbi:MAG: autotransporter-associated beta strand repeat-containing protein [Rhodocyclaceae bacterium]
MRLAVMAALASVSVPSMATPVVYFQTIADGRNYFDTTVGTYGGVTDTATFSGLGSGTSWVVGDATITPTNGNSRSIQASYLSSAPSLNGSGTGQAISMSASAQNSEGTGLTFTFNSAINAFGIELGDWGTCCFPSSLYIQFGTNGVWETAQLIGTATARSDVPEVASGTYAFIGAINDTATFNQVRIYGDGDGDALYAGGVLRTGTVDLNSVPASAGSSTQNPVKTGIDSSQPAFSSKDLVSGTIDPVFDGGVLRMDSSDTFAQNVTIKNSGGSIDINGNSAVLSGVIADDKGASGGLTVRNGGNGGSLRLTGENTYTGGTVVEVGAQLIVGDGANAGSIVGNVANEGFLGFDRADSTQFGGNISGNGGVAQLGSGVLTLSGESTYTGGTYIGKGTLSISADNNLGATGSNVLINGGTLATTASIESKRSITLSGSGILDVSDKTTLGAYGTIDGKGALVKQGNGTLVLGGINTYTGGTVLAGGTTVISSDANLGSSDGAITFAGGTLRSTANTSSARNITMEGADAVLSVDAGTAFVSSGNVSGGNSLIKNGSGAAAFTGVASHTGGTIVNDGVLVLSGDNTYTGGTTLNGGTLSISKDANLGNASGALTFNGGVLETTGSLQLQRTVELNAAANVTTASGTTLTASGPISGVGQLIKNGSGMMIADGVLSNKGGVVVNDGTLALSGQNTYTGNTIVNGGRVAVSSDAALGNAANSVVLNGGDLTVTASMQTLRGIVLGAGNGSITTATGVTFNAGGSVTGTGGLIKNGSGTLVMSGVNSYAGDTVINGGVVKVDTGSSLGKGVVLLNGGILQTTATLGSQQTVLVSGQAGVNVDAGTSAELGGQIASVGSTDCFVKRGQGALNLSGSVSLSKGTCVEEGVLRANGTLDSTVLVADAGTLRGTGVITGPIYVQGTLAPGNSPGTLNATSSVTMADSSTLQIDVDGTGTGNGAGNYSRLIVSGADNQFVAAGTLAPVLRGITGSADNTFTPSLGQTFRIVEAEGGVTGRFTQLTQPGAGLAPATRFAAFYNVFGSNAIDLRVVPESYRSYMESAGANANARSMGGALDTLATASASGAASTRQSELMYVVAGLPQGRIAEVARGLSGEVYGAMAAAAPAAARRTQDEVARHLRQDALADPESGSLLWVNVSRSQARVSGDDNASASRSTADQITVGADLLRSRNGRFGIGVAHNTTDVSANDASASMKENIAFIYGEQAVSDVRVDGMLAYGKNDGDVDRADPLGMRGGLSSSANGRSVLVSAAARLPMAVAGNSFEPFARITWQRVTRDAVSEDASALSALQVDKSSLSGTRAVVGAALASKVADPLATVYTYRLVSGVGVDMGELSRPTLKASINTAQFDITTPHSGRVFFQLNLDATARFGRQVYGYAGVTGEVASGRSDVGVTAGLRAAF